MRIATCVENCFRSRLVHSVALEVCRKEIPTLTIIDIQDQYRLLKSLARAAADDRRRDEAKFIHDHAARETRLKKACTNPSYAVIESSDGDGVPRVEYVHELAVAVIVDGVDDAIKVNKSLRGGAHYGLVDHPLVQEFRD